MKSIAHLTTLFILSLSTSLEAIVDTTDSFTKTAQQAILVNEPVASVFWDGLPRDAAGNFHSPWFGNLKDLSRGALYYHFEHGWISFAGDSTATLYWYDLQLEDWFMTTPDIYPILYKYGANTGWYGYRRGGTQGERWFYRFSNSQWVQEGDINAAPPAVFVLIPAGTFTMGSPDDEPGRQSLESQHMVTLTRPFYLQQTEVMKAQWDEVVAQGPARDYTDLPPGRNGSNGDASGTHPVTSVSWYDVLKWMNLKSELEGLTPCYTIGGATYKTGQSTPICDYDANGYRLPTESEWEYACRAGTTTAFYSGPITHTGSIPIDPNLDLIGWYYGNSNYNTHPVGQKQPNAWELYDMTGNIFEWCWDWYDTYPGTATDPTGPSSGFYRVYRGGSFNELASGCRSAGRNTFDPGTRMIWVGFRPARTATQ